MLNKNKMKKIVLGHAGSGLSVDAYCRKLGIRSNRFYYWRKALQDVKSDRFVEVPRGEVMAEVNIAGDITVRVPVSAVAGLIRSLGCER